jgi:hypothetical protein
MYHLNIQKTLHIATTDHVLSNTLTVKSERLLPLIERVFVKYEQLFNTYDSEMHQALRG